MSPRLRRWLLAMGIFIALFLGFLAWAAAHYVEPKLRERIGILIVQGSDSLYTYKLDRLHASLFGGNVEIDGLEIRVDSNRYRKLQEEQRLPALVLELDMPHGHLRGLGIWSLLIGRKVHINELFTSDARIELWRQNRELRRNAPPPPLWKSIRPNINEIVLDRLELQGVRFAYRFANDSGNLQLKFDTCNALIKDVRVDSAASVDPERIGFARIINLHFFDLKYRSADSSFKLKAKVIDYSSEDKLLSISDFKLQPTLKDKESFYAKYREQKQMTVIEFGRLDLKKFRLEAFFHDNAVVADSLVIDSPHVSLYVDKTTPPTLEGKTGTYPHQRLLNAGQDIDIRAIALRNAALTYTERGEKSGAEGTLRLDGLQLLVTNATNRQDLIRKDSICRMDGKGLLLGSPIHARFDLNLTDPYGRFSAEGTIGPAQAGPLNNMALALAYVELTRFDLDELRFRMQGDEYTATADVWMRYRNLFLELKKEDPKTGLLQSKKFLNKIINKYTIRHDNPEGGVAMMARGAQRSRLMTQTFFGLIWQTIFSGMQTIMTNTGEPE